MPPERVKNINYKFTSPLSLHSQTALPKGEPLVLYNFLYWSLYGRFFDKLNYGNFSVIIFCLELIRIHKNIFFPYAWAG